MKLLSKDKPAVLEHGLFLPAEFCQKLAFAMRREQVPHWPMMDADKEALKRFQEALREAASVL